VQQLELIDSSLSNKVLFPLRRLFAKFSFLLQMNKPITWKLIGEID
jgi:hypothetical protein